MTRECEFCDRELDCYSQLRTHYLLKHRDRIEDSEEYSIQWGPESLDSTSRAEKGEQFGYRK